MRKPPLAALYAALKKNDIRLIKFIFAGFKYGKLNILNAIAECFDNDCLATEIYSFLEFNKSELFFVNPTSKRVNFSIDKNHYSLEKGCSILIDVRSNEDISIISRCLFLRPIIFNYKGDFFDVYHA